MFWQEKPRHKWFLRKLSRSSNPWSFRKLWRRLCIKLWQRWVKKMEKNVLPNCYQTALHADIQQLSENMRDEREVKLIKTTDVWRPMDSPEDIGKSHANCRFHERDAWAAVKGVWSSLFALRPWVSLAKAGRVLAYHWRGIGMLIRPNS